MMMPTELACDDVPVRIDWQFADVKLWQTQMLLQEVERVMTNVGGNTQQVSGQRACCCCRSPFLSIHLDAARSVCGRCH